MGLGVDTVEAVFREHKYRPIKGDVLLMGRQAVYLSRDEILDVVRRNGLDPRLSAEEIEIDKSTINRDAAMENNRQLITDKSVFQLLGVNSVKALDHSDYEGAEIIHDLTRPLPENLKGIADFVVDGSTLDNVFNPARAIQTYAELLRPGGRIIMANMFSNHNEPYNIMPPVWYLDYFTANGFIDCKIYIIVVPPQDANLSNAFCIDLEWVTEPDRRFPPFDSPYLMGVMAFAEKGPNSTSDIMPSQQHYRSESDWKSYRKNLAVIQSNPRPHIVRSRSPMFFLGVTESHPHIDIRGGHLFMNDNFEAVDPTSEAARQKRMLSDLKPEATHAKNGWLPEWIKSKRLQS